MFNDSAMNGFITSILRCGIMNLEDAKDMAFIIPKLNNARMSIHNFMFRASLLRMYSKPSTYKALCQHVGAPQPGSRPPDFKSMKKALVKLYAARESQNKQRRHPRPLPSGEVGADSVGTQALPLKHVWNCEMRTEIFFVGNDQESRTPNSFNQNQPLKTIEKRNENQLNGNERMRKTMNTQWKYSNTNEKY